VKVNTFFQTFLRKVLLPSCSKSIPPCSFVALFGDFFGTILL